MCFGSVLQRLSVIARDSVDVNIVIEGETGCGKEVAVQYFLSELKKYGKGGGSKIINCSAIPAALIESEMFGYERGAFTGANATKKGFLEVAGKWVGLDEVTSMDLQFQAKMLRAIESKSFMRVGGRDELRHNCNFIAMTNVSLPNAVESGDFRVDLMYRLSGVVVRISPLRERRDEIISLFREFTGKRLSRSAKNVLVKHDWPGNVRELKNVAAIAVINSNAEKSSVISSWHIQFNDVVGGEDQNIYKRIFMEKIHSADFDFAKSSLAANMSQATFYRYLKRYDLELWYKSGRADVKKNRLGALI